MSNNNFLQRKAISILNGDQNKSASTALRVYVKGLTWGHTVPGYAEDDGVTPKKFADKFFYAIEDRSLVDASLHAESTDYRIFTNQVRKHIVIVEGGLVKRFSIVILVAMLVMGALSTVLFKAGANVRAKWHDHQAQIDAKNLEAKDQADLKEIMRNLGK